MVTLVYGCTYDMFYLNLDVNYQENEIIVEEAENSAKSKTFPPLEVFVFAAV